MTSLPPTAASSTSGSTVTVLSISPAKEDHRILEAIFDDSAEMLRADSVPAALDILQDQPVPIVICERDLGAHTWKSVLETVREMPRPPLLIVTSRLADDYLWSEALNLGAFDVLAKPFDHAEVIRTVGSAWRRWAN